MTALIAPCDDLIRMKRGKPDFDTEGRTLTGYAAVFNSDTVINSWEGNFVERIAPGAFKRTVRNNGDQVRVLFNHGMDPMIGDKPLGRWTVLEEDKTGLRVEVPLSRTSYNDDLIELLNDGALDGMSFRFSVLRESWQEPDGKSTKLPIRTLEEIRLHEFGPVTFPAYHATTAGVRSRETFAEWRNLSDDKRQQIIHILGTPDPGLAASTPGVGPADAGHDSDSASGHSQRAARIRHLALARRAGPYLVSGGN